MDLSLDESQMILERSFSEFFSRECPPSLVREPGKKGYSPELWQLFSEMGAPAMGMPEKHGGLDLGLLDLCLVAGEAGKVLAPLPFAEVAAAGRLFSCFCSNFPSLEGVVEQIAAGETLLSLAIPAGINTRSSQALIPAGGVVDWVLALEDEVLYLYADPECRRLETVDNLGDGCQAFWQLGELTDAPRIALAQGQEAVRAFDQAVAEWKLLTAAALQGLAQSALDIAVDYAKTREQFGGAIASFQAIAHPLADCAMSVDGAELLVREAAWSATEQSSRFIELSAMAFIFSSQTAQETASVSLHTHGGYGFTEEYDIQLYYRRACSWALMGGGISDELLHLADLRASGRSKRIAGVN